MELAGGEVGAGTVAAAGTAAGAGAGTAVVVAVGIAAEVGTVAAGTLEAGVEVVELDVVAVVHLGRSCTSRAYPAVEKENFVQLTEGSLPSKEVVESVPDAREESSLWESRGAAKQRNQ